MYKLSYFVSQHPAIAIAQTAMQHEELNAAIVQLEDIYNNVRGLHEDKNLILSLLITIGECYEDIEDYHHAIVFFLKAEQVAIQINDADIYKIYGELGWLYAHAKEEKSLDKAIAYNTLALQEEEDITFVLYVLYNQAEIYHTQNKQNLSINTLLKARDLCLQTGEADFLYIVYEHLAEYSREYKNYENALHYYKEASKYTDKLQTKAVIYNEIGNVLKNIPKQRHKAIKWHKKSLHVLEQYPYDKDIITVLSALGYSYHDNKDFDVAIGYYDKAIQISIRTENEDMLANIYFNIGDAYLSIRDYKKAEDYFLKGIEIGEKQNKLGELFFLYAQIVRIYIQWGDLTKAEYFSQKAIDATQQLNSNEDISAIYNNLATILRDIGNLKKALQYQNLALENGDKNRANEYSRQLHNKGAIYHRWADYETALYYYKQALEIAETNKIKENIAIFLGSMGVVLFSLYQYEQALDYCKKSFELRKHIGDKQFFLASYLQFAELYDHMENTEQAIDYLNKSMKIAELPDYISELSSVYNLFGNVYLGQEKYQLAIEFYKKALDLDLEYRYKQQALADRQNIGSCYYYLKDYDNAIKYLKTCLAATEEFFSEASLNQKRTYLADEIRTYNLLAASFFGQEKVFEAIEVLEMSRARVLTETILRQQSVPICVNTLIQEIPKNSIVIYYTIVENTDIIISLINQKIRKAYKISLDVILDEIYEQFGIERFKRSFSKASVYRTDTTHFNINKNRLKLVIEYYIYRITTLPNVFWQIKSKQQATLKLSNYLYDLLIKPISEDIKPYKDLIIIPDGSLWVFPFETLYDGTQYMIEKYNISYVNSLRVLSVQKQKEYTFSNSNILAFGDAIYKSTQGNTQDGQSMDKNALIMLRQKVINYISENKKLTDIYELLGVNTWSELPYSLREVESIQNLFPTAEIYTGGNVCKNTFKTFSANNFFSKFKIVHIATHGIAFSGIPELSALVLSEESSSDEEDRYLKIQEIENLHIPSEFVFLSACETGTGRIYAGDGILGLSQAFFQAGVKGIVVTLWQIADQGTNLIVESFYDNVNKGMSYTDSLRKVKIDCINGALGNDLTNPFYWAAFVNYGDCFSKFDTN